jgi:hypothetical protein
LEKYIFDYSSKQQISEKEYWPIIGIKQSLIETIDGIEDDIK